VVAEYFPAPQSGHEDLPVLAAEVPVGQEVLKTEERGMGGGVTRYENMDMHLLFIITKHEKEKARKQNCTKQSLRNTML
jgi:hypothetical protein